MADPTRTRVTDDGWEEIDASIPPKVELDVGDEFTGVYQGSKTAKNPKDGEEFTVLQFTDALAGDEELPRCTITPGFILKSAFEQIPEGSTVRLTRLEDIPSTQRNRSATKDYKVLVKR